MSGKHFLLGHQAYAVRWAKASDGLSEIITADGIYSSKVSPIDLLEEMGDSAPVIFQTEPSDHIDCVWFLNQSFKTFKVEEYLTCVAFDDRTRLLIPVRKEFLDEKCNRLHTFLYKEGQLNYIFPCIKEFNQQYYSIAYTK